MAARSGTSGLPHVPGRAVGGQERFDDSPQFTGNQFPSYSRVLHNRLFYLDTLNNFCKLSYTNICSQNICMLI